MERLHSTDISTLHRCIRAGNCVRETGRQAADDTWVKDQASYSVSWGFASRVVTSGLGMGVIQAGGRSHHFLSIAMSGYVYIDRCHAWCTVFTTVIYWAVP